MYMSICTRHVSDETAFSTRLPIKAENEKCTNVFMQLAREAPDFCCLHARKHHDNEKLTVSLLSYREFR